jgi:hypothetical protein
MVALPRPSRYRLYAMVTSAGVLFLFIHSQRLATSSLNS